MRKYFQNIYDSFIKGYQLTASRSEVFLVQATLLFLAYIFTINSYYLADYIRLPLQYLLFLVELTFALCTPRFLTNQDQDLYQRLRYIYKYVQKTIPDLFIFTLVIFISNRLVSNSEYIQAYNETHSQILQMFIVGIYRLILIATSVYFSIRLTSLAQSIIDAIAFVFSHFFYSFLISILLIPIVFIGPLYLNTPFALIEGIAEQVGFIFLVGFVTVYMQINDAKLQNTVKHIVLSDPLGRPYATSFRRLSSILIDAIIYGALCVMVSVFFLNKLIYTFSVIEQNVGIAAYILLFLLYVGGSWLLFAGKTPGKIITGIQVCSADGSKLKFQNSMIRLIVMVCELFGIFFLATLNNQQHLLIDVGYIIVLILWACAIGFLFNKRKKSLHDYIAGTVVIEK